MFRIATRVARPSFQVLNTASRPTFRSFASQGAQKRVTTSLFTRQTQSKSKELLFQPKRSIGTSKRALQQIPQQFANSTNSLNYIVGGVAAAGLVGLAAHGFATAEADPRADTVRSRIRFTYVYLAGSLGVTALAARAFFQSGLALRMAQTNPWVVFGLSLAGMIGAQIAVHAIPYENTIPKHLAFGGFCGIMGAALCPIVAVGGPVILQAAAATGTIVGSLSLVGAAAPEGTFSGMTGPLTIGLGCLLAASVGTMAFPAVGILQNIVVYGGTALFGFFVLHDTQKVIERAKYSERFDPINNCMGIYMDTINIFINMVTILSNNRRK